MDKILEVKGLTKLYKNKRGIRDISFEVYRGDIFGFLGPNGAGKTTTMKAITSLCRIDSGEIRILGYDISHDFEKAMQRVGCIIETSEAFEYMSAYKNLEMAARFYKDIKPERIDEVLKIVGLEKYKNEKVSGYSLGMKQRLGLAAAILSEPELIILDEPVNGLDIEGMVDIRNIIKSLASDNKITFFISSHLIHEMELLCNRIGVIEDGRLIETGTVNELTNGHSNLEDFYMKKISENRGYKQ